jgi:ribosomally synthesized peptide (two-chain TOMM family)
MSAILDRESKMSLVDPLKAYDELAKWERVWIEVVALAWKDADFRKALLEDEGKGARALIKGKFHFELPPDVEVRVVAASPQEKSWDNHKTHVRAMTQLRLVLPTPPAVAADHAIALSHYVAAGLSMPFTCCC